jgi:hypothetical protein
MLRRICPNALSVFAILVFAATAALAEGPYVKGSPNTVTANFPIPRPSTTPCVVTLLNNAEFDNFNPVSFNYAPPTACPGPWAAVILTAAVNVTAGIQYDRTANFWLGPTAIYFGTTAEPSPDFGPSWYVESDLTGLSAVFQTAQQGTADIGNLVNSTYTGIIFATATLEFYPLASGQTAPSTANQVYSLSGGPTGGTVGLSDTTSTLSGTFTFPTNVTNAYLDVYSQSQSNDEFWYTCVPDNVATELESCSNTGFRETEVTIDGTPAGVAPVSPWIFTGGVDPYLWFPLPGVQTLEFAPYQLDLSPFAATLSNGQPHTIAVSVYNADSYFSDTANLYIYQDTGATTITGATTLNTLAAPNPITTENLNVTSSSITGSVQTKSNRDYTISGYINTSRGKVVTTVRESVDFTNKETFDINDSEYLQEIAVTSNVNSSTTVSRPGKPVIVRNRNQDFPLNFNILVSVTKDGGQNQTSTSWQDYNLNRLNTQGGVPTYADLVTNSVQSTDTLEFNSSGDFIGNKDQKSSQLYSQIDTDGLNEYCVLKAADNVLKSFSHTCSQGDASGNTKPTESGTSTGAANPLVSPWKSQPPTNR